MLWVTFIRAGSWRIRDRGSSSRGSSSWRTGYRGSSSWRTGPRGSRSWRIGFRGINYWGISSRIRSSHKLQEFLDKWILLKKWFLQEGIILNYFKFLRFLWLMYL